MAAYAEIAEGEDGPELFLRASVTAIDGSDGVRGSLTGQLPDAAALGRALAAELLDRGAAELMAVSPMTAHPQTPTRARTTSGPGSGARDDAQPRDRTAAPAGSSSSAQDRATPAC